MWRKHLQQNEERDEYNNMINMSDELSKQFHEFLKKYGLKL